MSRKYLVRVTADASDAFDGKVERCKFISSFAASKSEPRGFEERHNERSQTAVNVKPKLVLLSKSRQSYDIVLIAIWEIDAGSYKLYI